MNECVWMNDKKFESVGKEFHRRNDKLLSIKQASERRLSEWVRERENCRNIHDCDKPNRREENVMILFNLQCLIWQEFWGSFNLILDSVDNKSWPRWKALKFKFLTSLPQLLLDFKANVLENSLDNSLCNKEIFAVGILSFNNFISFFLLTFAFGFVATRIPFALREFFRGERKWHN